MRNIAIVLYSICILLCACNRNDDTPPTEINLSIAENYMPSTVPFQVSDTEWIEKIKDWDNKQLIVNSTSEMPNDPLGFSDAYKNINFNTYSLLITYDIHNWPIDTYKNRYYWDNIEKSYNWAICIKTATVPDNSAEEWYFTRYSILVKKLPTDANIKIWFSLGALNWEW